jgi:hypothetical protein
MAGSVFVEKMLEVDQPTCLEFIYCKNLAVRTIACAANSRTNQSRQCG